MLLSKCLIDVPASNCRRTSASFTEKFSGTDFSASLAAATMLPAARLPFADTPEVITVLALVAIYNSQQIQVQWQSFQY